MFHLYLMTKLHRKLWRNRLVVITRNKGSLTRSLGGVVTWQEGVGDKGWGYKGVSVPGVVNIGLIGMLPGL